MVHGQSVLVIDRSPDLQEVLQAALALKGWTVNWLRTPVEQVPETRPGLVVIDADRSGSSNDRCAWEDIPQVILSENNPESMDVPARREHLRKPFQYRDLMRKIEGLLGDRRESDRGE